MGMRVSLAGMLSNAARCIDELAAIVCEREGFKFKSGQSGDVDSPDCFAEIQPLANAFMLREAMKHAQETAKGEHSLEEFAEFYCLQEEAK